MSIISRVLLLNLTIRKHCNSQGASGNKKDWASDDLSTSQNTFPEQVFKTSPKPYCHTTEIHSFIYTGSL